MLPVPLPENRARRRCDPLPVVVLILLVLAFVLVATATVAGTMLFSRWVEFPLLDLTRKGLGKFKRQPHIPLAEGATAP